MKSPAKNYDPYENVVDVMEKAVEIGHINKSMFEIIESTTRNKSISSDRNG